MLVQCMVGNTCCELCDQTLFVGLVGKASGFPFVCSGTYQFGPAIGDTIRMQGAYSLPLFLQKGKTFTESLTRGVGASWEEGGRVKKGVCVDVKNWMG